MSTFAINWKMYNFAGRRDYISKTIEKSKQTRVIRWWQTNRLVDISMILLYILFIEWRDELSDIARTYLYRCKYVYAVICAVIGLR